MSANHTPYFELRDALLAGGCPMCRLGNRAATGYMSGALYEGMTVPSVRNRLRAAQGLCRRHGWQLVRLRTSNLGTAIVYRDVLADLIAALDDPASGGRGGLFGRQSSAGLPEPQLPCPACETEKDEAMRTGDVLRAHLGDSVIEAAFRSAGGLCLPHLRLILGRAGRTEAQTLRAWQMAAYRELRGELDELIRKHDYRFAGEPIGAEGDAWLRAMARVVGEPDPEPS
jgi:hypothetical protein